MLITTENSHNKLVSFQCIKELLEFNQWEIGAALEGFESVFDKSEQLLWASHISGLYNQRRNLLEQLKLFSDDDCIHREVETRLASINNHITDWQNFLVGLVE